MTFLTQAVMGLFLVLFLEIGEGNAQELTFYSHNFKAQVYFDENGLVHGREHAGKRAFNIELVREIIHELDGRQPSITEVPFKRGFHYLQTADNIVFFNVSRTPEREHLAKWVGPLQTETDYFYELKRAPTGVKTLEDVKKVDAVCVLNGSVHHSAVKEAEFSNFVLGNSYAECFNLLELGRVQLTPSAESTVDQKITAAYLSPKSLRKTPVILHQSGGYMAFSKNVDDNIIQKYQQALDAIKESGRYEQLYARFFLPKAI